MIIQGRSITSYILYTYLKEKIFHPKNEKCIQINHHVVGSVDLPTIQLTGTTHPIRLAHAKLFKLKNAGSCGKWELHETYEHHRHVYSDVVSCLM